MNLFKKAVASIALVTLVSGIFSTGVSAYSTAQLEAANDLAARGIIVTKADAAGYALDQNVLRQEIAAVARGVAGLEKSTTVKGTFSDVTATTPNNWAVYSVEPLADAGLIAKNATFRPEDKISKAEAIGMMVKAAFGDAYAYDASKGTSWQQQVVAFAVENGVASNFTNYDTPATRGFVFEAGSAAIAATEVADEDDLLGDLLGGLVGDDTDTTNDTNDTNDTTTPVVSGDNVLIATLSPETPASTDLPNGAEGVVVAKFDLTAGSEDVSVNSLVLKRTGLGSSDAVDKVAIFDETGRVSKIKSFNSSTDDATVNFSDPVVVKAGSTKTLTIKINTIGTGSFAIELVSVSASSSVDGEGVLANAFEVKDTTASELTISTDGTSTDPKLGEEQAEILKFKVKNDSESNEDITLTELTLKENESIDEESELANVALYYDGEKVAEVASLTSKYVTFELNEGIVIEDGKTEKFVVRADIIGGASKDIQFYLDNELDVTATASKYGYVNVTNENLNLDGVAAVTVQAGEVTISAIEPTKTDIRKDKNDVEFGKIKIVANAGKDLELQQFKVTFENTGTASDVSEILDSVELYDETNGTLYDLTAPETAATSETYYDTDMSIAIPNGEELTLVIRADTLKVDITDVKLSASVDVANDLVIRETEDDTRVSDIVPATISFKTVTGVEASALVNKVSMSASKSAVVGSTGIEAHVFEVKSDNDASDLTVDEIKVKAVVVDNASGGEVLGTGTLTLTAGDDVTAADTYIATVAGVNVSGTVSFDTDLATTAAALATSINSTTSTPNYTATSNGAVVTISAVAGSGETSNGFLISATVVDGGGVAPTVTNGEIAGGVTAAENAGSDTTGSGSRINAVYLYDGDTQLDRVSGSSLADGVATFNGFKVTIPKNSSKRFTVKTDIVDDSNQANDTINFQVTSVSIEDDESTDVTPTFSSSPLTSDRTITIKGVGTLTATVDNTDTETDKDKNVLGGVTSSFVASYELTATNEGILIKDFELDETSGTENLQGAVSEVIVYANDKTTEIARQTVVSEPVTFNNANFTIPEGNSNIYVKVVTNKQGKDQAGKQTADLAFALTVTDAEGAASSKVVENPDKTGSSKNFSVNPVKISAISFVNSYGGEQVSTSLTNGENTLGVIAITTDSTTNTKVSDGSSLKTELESLIVTVNSDNDTNGVLSKVTVERINGVIGAKNVANEDGTSINTFTSGGQKVNLFKGVSLDTDEDLENGVTTYFVIKGTFSGLSSSTNKYVQLKIENLDTTAIQYSSDNIAESDADNSSATDEATDDITSLRIGVTSLSANSISSKY